MPFYNSPEVRFWDEILFEEFSKMEDFIPLDLDIKNFNITLFYNEEEFIHSMNRVRFEINHSSQNIRLEMQQLYDEYAQEYNKLVYRSIE